jgi:hypothetical protein
LPIVADDKLEQPINVLEPTVIIVFGIVIFVKLEQVLNASVPIEVIAPDPKVNDVNAQQFLHM